MLRSLFFATAIAVCLPPAFASQGAEAQIWCRDKISNEIVQVTKRGPVTACYADAVWGFDNVCYEGSAGALVTQINSRVYDWLSSGLRMSDAELSSDQTTVIFIGTEARSFYASAHDLTPCAPDFFN